MLFEFFHAILRFFIKKASELNAQAIANKHNLTRHIESVYKKSGFLEFGYCGHKEKRRDDINTHVKNNHNKHNCAGIGSVPM